MRMYLAVVTLCAIFSYGLASVCDWNWQYFNGKCYYVYKFQRYSYAHASDICKGMDANLVIIEDELENRFLKGFCEGEYDLRIGLTNSKSAGEWKWGYAGLATFKDWGDNEPKDLKDEHERCAYLKGCDTYNKWAVGSCTALMGFICERNIVCKVEPVGVESGAITDAQMTASSSWSGIHLLPSHGRLNYISRNGFYSSWSAGKNEVGEFLQIDLGSNRMVTKVATQGRGDDAYPQRVTSYNLAYNNGVYWNQVKDSDGQDKVYAGNTDHVTTVYHELGSDSFIARYVRFVVLTCHLHISMRVEVYSCD